MQGLTDGLIPPSLWVQYFHYLAQATEMKAQIFLMFSSIHGPIAQNIRKILTQSTNPEIMEIDVEVFLQVSMTYAFNAADVNPQPLDGYAALSCLGIGLFPIACKMQHSCSPNTVWTCDDIGRWY